jgi:hypothetical protein
MASNIVECFTDRTIDLFPCPALLDDLRRLQLKETPAGWRLVPARTQQGHGDRATALALAVLAAKREGARYAGPWPEAAPPTNGQQSYFSGLPAETFAPSRLAPAGLSWGLWPAGQDADRPL